MSIDSIKKISRYSAFLTTAKGNMLKARFVKLLGICLIVVILCSLFSVSVFADSWVFNQTITAYRSDSGARCASEVVPYQGAVAQHPKIRGDYSSPPLFGFGAICTLDVAVPMYGGGSRTTFTVEDIGDVNYRDYDNGKLTKWWLDVWQGVGPIGGTVYNWCMNTFGTRYSNYSATNCTY